MAMAWCTAPVQSAAVRASRRPGADTSCSRAEMEMLRSAAVNSCAASRGTTPASANGARISGSSLEAKAA